MRKLWAGLTTLACALAFVGDAARAADESLPRINVVLFSPADVTPPPDAAARLNEVANYTEAFFARWMKQWGYPAAREKIFDRNADGTVRVLQVQGAAAAASGKYDKPGFESEVWSQAVPKYQLGRQRHVWWIWVYLGDPPARFRGFEGRGNVRNGGNALVNYLNARGTIRPGDELGSPFLDEFSLKGSMHELGHALGLPHNGPVARENLGMPLMGATIANYRNRTRTQETRGYLTAASAAMLWKHPIFSGTAAERDVLPSVTFANLKLVPVAASKTWRLTGRVAADLPAHSVVVLDSVPGEQDAYWQKSYVAKVDADGSFACEIVEPTGRNGTFKLLACFRNGAVTGDGKDYGIQGTFDFGYQSNGAPAR